MYSPKVQDEQVRQLYKLKVLSANLTGKRKPMTTLVKEAIEEYLTKENERINQMIRDEGMTTVSSQVMDAERQKEKN